MDRKSFVRLGEIGMMLFDSLFRRRNEHESFTNLASSSSWCALSRLNFDYDIRRGNENGPWADLIPIDGRDTWRFTLAYNDQYDDEAWRAVPSSFVNLGRESRNRCWPWTSDEVLPYRRTGADAPVWGNGPGGALQVHVDLGPFLERNVGRRMPNTMQAFAA
jgi:hypothetical protein